MYGRVVPDVVRQLEWALGYEIPDMTEIRSLVETSAYVDDLDRADQFYREVLGLTAIAREPGRHVFFRVGAGDVLLLFRADETSKA